MGALKDSWALSTGNTMSDTNPADTAAGQTAAIDTGAIDAGSYDVLRARLEALGKDLQGRTQTLNQKRLEVFGGQEMAVIGSHRIRTENSCLPRDILTVGKRLLFGYNVQIGLRKTTRVQDVFGLYAYEQSENGDTEFRAEDWQQSQLLGDPKFGKLFTELYRYYKDARLLQLRHREGKLLAIFQVGSTSRDVKVLRWLNDPKGPKFLDDNGARDHVFPPTQDFEWAVAGRDDFVFGDHSHVNILDEVFVETIGGDLTIKVENNTQDGKGIYSEPVNDPHQTLDDSTVHYVKIGTLILLKIQPFGESAWRYFVYNTRTKSVSRNDAIGRACVQLPEDHGIIFPGGYYLQSGEMKTFAGDSQGMRFLKTVKSPNGEDVLYVFYEVESGLSILLPYNLIRKQVQNPIICHGYGLFPNGHLVVFKADTAATRVHPMQVWQTPFMSDEHAAALSVASEHAGSLWVKIGNAELVRGISEIHSIHRLIATAAQTPSVPTYEDLVAAVTRTVDGFYWLADEAVGDIASVVREVSSTAELIIGEFAKVQTIKAESERALAKAEDEQTTLFRSINPESWRSVDQFVDAMGKLRRSRGHLITLKDLRYVDLAKIEALEAQVEALFESLSRKATDFLLKDDAFAVYHQKCDDVLAQTQGAKHSPDLDEPLKALQETAENLDILTEVIGTLEIEDPSARTNILEAIAEVLGLINRGKATALGRRKELLRKEGAAEFGAQFKLLSQSVQSAIGMAETPEKCDELLTRLMVQLEELEGRFGEFDEFIEDITQKREEVYNAFGAKKQQLLDERQRKADSLAQAGQRIIKGIKRKALTFQDVDELNAYFATDAMVMKARELAQRLVDIGDTMRADQAVAGLKSVRDEAARALRDKVDLYAGNENTIKLGDHFFSVNRQELQLTMLPRTAQDREEFMATHLTGTGFFQAIEDEELKALKPYWHQELVSENAQVYRGEYLAACLLFAAQSQEHHPSLTLPRLFAAQQKGMLIDLVREFSLNRFDEGYARGIHDVDAAAILDRLLSMHATAGLLRFAPRPRALACLFWSGLDADDARAQAWRASAQNLGRLRETFGTPLTQSELPRRLSAAIDEFLDGNDIPYTSEDSEAAGIYLAEELACEKLAFITSGEAERLADGLLRFLEKRSMRAGFMADLEDSRLSLGERYALAQSWFGSFLAAQGEGDLVDLRALHPVLREAAVLLLTPGLERERSNALPAIVVEGILGQHERVEDQKLEIRFDEFLERLHFFIQEHVPAYGRFRALRSRLLDRQYRRLRVEEFKPRPLTSFVRNKLINDVYLHLVGDNLAKQMGAEGDAKRSDLMGLLLLISPPGYGKTTLMEYIADRLGLTFMKINGPALGHSVTSLDPEEAPNATARQEIEKLNLALEMGNNVMLYLDDIQHTHPELLQKFISLCDGQRRIEGVWQGKTKTYDMRGRRFCVVMAGNPYTESGDKFQIPDMLANRADVYNLGDMLSGNRDVFELSYIENSMTSNRTLAALATRSPKDLYAFVRMAKGESVEAGELSHSYSKADQDEIVSVLKKMFVARDVLLMVNSEYIASAAQDDRFRTEPRFQLQGSYRNMNKLAEKIVAVMNHDDLQALIDDHYAGEAQTLTSGAEANILKLKELRGVLSAAETARWEEIKKGFRRHQLAGGGDDDPVTRVTNQLNGLGIHLEAIGDAIEQAVGGQVRPGRGQSALGS